MRYHITFACYGTHLHGDECGSVDRHHNIPGNRLAEANPQRVEIKRDQMDQPPYYLNDDRRLIVLTAIRDAYQPRSRSSRNRNTARVSHEHLQILRESRIE
jgi:hypothetical protein